MSRAVCCRLLSRDIRTVKSPRDAILALRHTSRGSCSSAARRSLEREEGTTFFTIRSRLQYSCSWQRVFTLWNNNTVIRSQWPRVSETWYRNGRDAQIPAQTSNFGSQPARGRSGEGQITHRCRLRSRPHRLNVPGTENWYHHLGQTRRVWCRIAAAVLLVPFPSDVRRMATLCVRLLPLCPGEWKSM